MFGKISSLIELFKAGSAVADPAMWKKGQITASLFIAVLYALVHVASAWGLNIPIDQDTINNVSVGALAVVNWVMTLITTDKIGIGKSSATNKAAP